MEVVYAVEVYYNDPGCWITKSIHRTLKSATEATAKFEKGTMYDIETYELEG